MAHQQGQWLWTKNVLALCLYPFSLLFCLLVIVRRKLYGLGFYAMSGTHCPLVVVGNITVGGNGKTPVVIALVKLLQERGYSVGIISRGYKSQAESTVTLLSNGEQNELIGDESNLMSELCGCPIGVGLDRVKTAQALEQAFSVDIIISDDGLQHYALKRDLDIVVHRKQALGNGWCLPAGPLREPRSRLTFVDYLISRDQHAVNEQVTHAWSLHDKQTRVSLELLSGSTVHAIAGIGFPELFFKQLKAQGIQIIEHYFPDHYEFSALDLNFKDDYPIVMTHKDAVKIRYIVKQEKITRPMWVAELDLCFSSDVQCELLQLIEPLINREQHG